MADPASEELRMLRARAYGPGADIHDDPAALARLRELEAAVAASAPERAPAADRDPALDPVVDAVPRADRPLDEGERAASVPAFAAADDGEPGDRTAPGAASPRRRRLWLLIGVGAAGLVLGAILTTLIAAFPANRIEVLARADDAEWPAETFGEPQEGGQVFDEFRELLVISIPTPWGGPGDGAPTSACLFVQEPEGQILTVGCSGEAFTATASFTVTETAPEALREEFPVGTSLKFVLDGSEVSVFAGRP